MKYEKELLNQILADCKKYGITGYDIGLHTSISEQSAYKILNGTTKNPRIKNLHIIAEYIETKKVGGNIPGHKNYKQQETVVKEPETVYKETVVKDIYHLRKDAEQLLSIANRLKQRLEQKKLPHTDVEASFEYKPDENLYIEERNVLLQTIELRQAIQKLKMRLEDNDIDFSDITEP